VKLVYTVLCKPKESDVYTVLCKPKESDVTTRKEFVAIWLGKDGGSFKNYPVSANISLRRCGRDLLSKLRVQRTKRKSQGNCGQEHSPPTGGLQSQFTATAISWGKLLNQKRVLLLS
jgi:hypothetical protein